MSEQQLDLFGDGGDGIAPRALQGRRSRQARPALAPRIIPTGSSGDSGPADPITDEAATSTIPKPMGLTAPTGLSVLAFPADRRIGKVRDVATKLMAKTTDRAIEHYRHQVTEGLLMNLASKHVPDGLHHDQVRRFWVAVDCEIARRVNGRCRPGGAA